jgi:histidine triad (HIT) family protein
LDVGPFFERVQRIAAATPIGLDGEGTFVAMNNVVSQGVAHLHAHVVLVVAAMGSADSSGLGKSR